MIAFILAVAISIPQPELTPGVVDSSVTIKQLCTPGYTARVRHVTGATKREVFIRYGIAQDGAKYEVDHFVSLEIGGLNDISNLWPQPWVDARRKDVVETWLHRQLCAGKMTLKQVQAAVRVWPRWYARIKNHEGM